MAPIRLFTSGTHNGMTFTNDNIDAILKKSLADSPERIPFTFGHPKNDLPVLGYLRRTDLQDFSEGDKKSIGFERSAADFSEESLQAMKSLKQNKLSIRLKEGVIQHIGLVKTPAVSENANQDFQALSGIYDILEDITASKKGFDFSDVKAYINDLFNKKQLPNMNTDTTEAYEALKKEKEDLQKKVEAQEQASKDFAAKQLLDGFKAKIKDFSLDETAREKAEKVAASLIATGGELDFSEDGKIVKSTPLDSFFDLLESGNKKQTVVNGSVVADFVKQDDKKGDDRSVAEDYIKQQINSL